MELLNSAGFQYSTFDILSDQEVRRAKDCLQLPRVTVYVLGCVLPLTGAGRIEEVQQLAHLPSILCEREADWGVGHHEGNG